MPIDQSEQRASDSLLFVRQFEIDCRRAAIDEDI